MKAHEYVSVYDRMRGRRTPEEAEAIRTERKFEERVQAVRGAKALAERMGRAIVNICEEVTE